MLPVMKGGHRMTPQERQRVEELFERLAALETQPRDAEAERAIMQGLRAAPNAVYPLVQTVLLQDEALRRADERIRALEAGGEAAPQQGSGFLDSMRDAFFGTGARGSVPPVGGRDQPMGVPPAWRGGSANPGNATPGAPYPNGPAQPEPSRGGSFLGTAAAAAVGVIGGSMLMNSMRNMLGSNHPANGTPSTMTDFGNSNSQSPWGGGDASSSDLAREAGLDHIGKGDQGDRAGLFDEREVEPGHEPFDSAEYEPDDDIGFDLGDSDFG
jgi:hypothetical protein